MSPNPYLKGVVVLASRPKSKLGESVIGINWGQLFYNPKGIIDDVMDHAKTPNIQLQAQNQYWGTQRTTAQANTAANKLGNTTAQQQLQATLQQQAAANAASLRSQFATTFPGAALPTAPPAPFQVAPPTYAYSLPTVQPTTAPTDGSVPLDANGNPIYTDPNAPTPPDPSQTAVVGAGFTTTPQNGYWGATKTADAASSANTVALRQAANAAVNAAMLQEATTMFQPVDLATMAAQANAAAAAANSYGAQSYGSQPYGTDYDSQYADDGGDTTPYDVMGGSPVATPPTDQYVVVHVKDIGKVIKAQSPLGGAAYGIVPQAIASVAYGKMRDQIAAALVAAGVDADVTLATQPPVGKSPKDLIVGIGVGAGSLAALWALFKLVTYKPHKGRK